MQLRFRYPRSFIPRVEVFKTFISKIFPYWLAAAITALVSVLYAKVFAWSEDLAFSWTRSLGYWCFLIIPLALLVSFLMSHFGSPEASGSGIPQLIAAVEMAPSENPMLKKLLGWSMIFIKFLSSCVCVAGGGVTGREGPMLQIAAGLFYQVRRYWPVKINVQQMILAGGAAGLASAFNTPLGGIVFAIEELGKVHLSQIRTYIFHSVIIAGLFAQAVLGNYLYIGKITVVGSGFSHIWPEALVALFIGSCAALMGVLMVKVLDWRSKQKLVIKSALAIGCGLIIAILLTSMGPHTVGSGRHLIIELLTQSKEPADFILALNRMATNFLTYIAGTVCGIFAPSLATGAVFGSFFSQFFPGSDPHLWILTGMVAFLTGVTRTPFTAMVLVLEMTDSHGAIIDLMVCAIMAQTAARLIDPVSFYEHMSERILHRHS